MDKQIELLDKEEIVNKSKEYTDLLDRRKLAKNFVSILKTHQANVFSINGGWGTGKTWFLKFVEEEIPEDVPFIKFNVWENDYLDDPFSSILAELSDLLDFSNDQIKELASKVTINASVGFVGNSIGFSYDPTKNISEYKKLKKEKEIFIKSLSKKIKTQIIIAIDELDRCRPDYAIKTLEVIKHFFGIPGIKFILAVDKEQLARTVKVMFGQDTDTDCYLRKFVDLEYNLPEYTVKVFVSYLITEKYPIITQKIEEFAKNNKLLYKIESPTSKNSIWSTGNQKEYSIKIISDILSDASKNGLCLREIEKIILRLSLVLNDFSEEDILEIGFLLQLIILNLKHINLFYKLSNKESILSISDEKISKQKIIFFSEFRKFHHYICQRLNNNTSISGEYKSICFNAERLNKYFDKINLIEGFE